MESIYNSINKTHGWEASKQHFFESPFKMFLVYQKLLTCPGHTRGRCQYRAFRLNASPPAMPMISECNIGSSLGHGHHTMLIHNQDHPRPEPHFDTPKICATCKDPERFTFYILRVYTVYSKCIGSVVTI